MHINKAYEIRFLSDENPSVRRKDYARDDTSCQAQSENPRDFVSLSSRSQMRRKIFEESRAFLEIPNVEREIFLANFRSLLKQFSSEGNDKIFSLAECILLQNRKSCEILLL